MNFIPINAFGVTDVDRQLFISDISTVPTITDRDNLIAQEGDIAKVTANNITYVFDGVQWINLVETSGTVTSVNGVQPIGGAIIISTTNVSEGTNFYYTNLRVRNEIRSIMSTQGDFLTRDGANNLIRLPVGLNGEILMSDGVKPKYASLMSIGGVISVNAIAPTNGDIQLTTNNLPELNNLYWTQARFDSRLGQFYQNIGDILIRKAINDLTALAIGTAGQFLRVNNGFPEWQTVNFSTNLSQLGDVSIVNIANNQLLQYNDVSQKWENKTVTYSSSLSGLSDVLLGTLTDQQIIRYDNANSKWKNYTLTLKNNLSELNDINLVNLADRQFISYNADTNKWLNRGPLVVTDISWNQANTGVKIINEIGGGLCKTLIAGTGITLDGAANASITINSNAAAPNLSTLGDCTITTPTTGQLLQYTANNKWENKTVTYATTNLTDVNVTNVQLDDILIYNTGQTKYINSQRFKTIETNYNTNVPPLLSQILTVDITNPTSYTLNYDNTFQGTFPIVKSTFLTVSPYLPLNNNADATQNIDFLRVNSNSGLNGYYNPITQFKKSEFYKLANWGVYDTQVRNFANDWLQYNNGGFIMNVNFSQNNLQVGTTYRLYSISAANAGVWVKLYGLKNVGLVAAQMTVETIPVEGADWDLLVDFQPSILNGVYSTQFTPANNIFLVRAIQNRFAWTFAGGVGIFNDTAEDTEMNLTAPDGIAVSTSTGSLVITNNNTNKTNESWKLSISNAMSYYLSTTVCKAIRGINSLFLSATQISDSWMRINNGNNNFQFQNTAGTTIYMTVGTNNQIAVANNRHSHIVYQGLTIVINIAVLNTNYVVIPNGVPNMFTFGSPQAFTLDANNRFSCNTAGIYKIDFSITIKLADPNEIYIRLSRNILGTDWHNTQIFGGIADDKFQTYTAHFISSFAVNDVVLPWIFKTSGGTNKQASILYYSITAMNTMNM